MSTWNYRVMEFCSPTEPLPWRAIHEVFYDEGGRPVGYTKDPAVVAWGPDDGDSAPQLTLERMREALAKPVLREQDFVQNGEETRYDKMFREGVQASIDDPRPSIPHEQVFAQWREEREALLKKE